MKWEYVKPLKSAKLIEKYEELTEYRFPQEFKSTIIEFNGGRPVRRTFNTNTNKERELKSFLSFNPDDKETIWKAYEWTKTVFFNRYLPFAIDNFGNLICFDTNDNCVIFLNHENLSVEYVADTFVSLLNLLYE